MMKSRQALVSPPVLVMPNTTGDFILVTDTSKTSCGTSLYQQEKGRYRLVAYYSKKLPDACSRYSISELEFTGLVACISAFKHMLKNVNFTVYVDHSALVHMLRGKREPPTLRLKKLLEQVSQYSFTIKFLKGKDMHISDFLSRHADHDTDSPNEIIPIAFMAEEITKMDDFLSSIPSTLLTSKLTHFDIINSFLDNHACDLCLAAPTAKAYPTRNRKKPTYFGYTPKPIQPTKQKKPNPLNNKEILG